MNFEFFIKIRKNIISRVQHIFYISPECPFHARGVQALDITSIHHYFIFVGLQRSIGQPKV